MLALSMTQTNPKLAGLKLALGYQDILWASGQVFLFRDFVEFGDTWGLDAIFAACPYGDLDDGQRQTFAACFHSPRLREIVAQWWQVYDEERSTGKIPSVGVIWQSRALPSGEGEPQVSLGPVGYQDVTRLAGLVFLRRGFLESANAVGLETTLACESAYGDLDAGQQNTFAACFHNPRLRQIVAQWWAAYDEERASGILPELSVWQA